MFDNPRNSISRFYLTALSLGLLLLLFRAQGAGALEINGDLSLEGDWFFEEAAFAGQRDIFTSVAANLEFYHPINDNCSLTISPFYRFDAMDSERTHGDLREAKLLYLGDSWELSAGLDRVFWGATEFVHLVDIINQTDQVESLDGEEKLGQPMVHLVIPRDWGTVEGFVLPWFRERTFGGRHARLRPPLAVDTDHPLYESASEEHHTDLALRYATSLSLGDIGLYYFTGTARDPVLLLSFDSMGSPSLVPYYEQIGQTGLDVQLVLGEWLLKGEALYRTGQGRSFAATTFGFEYTLVGIGGTMMDLGLLGEYVYDDRDNGWLPTIYDNDLMAGLRLSVNDMADSRILVGLIRDFATPSTIIGLEASRRLGDSIRLSLEGSLFIDIDPQDPAYSLAQDDFVRLEVTWYF